MKREDHIKPRKKSRFSIEIFLYRYLLKIKDILHWYFNIFLIYFKILKLITTKIF